MSSKKLDIITADVGDYLKFFAVTAVISQPILTMALATNPSSNAATWIGIIFNLVKYTAPAFIFGILYTTIRTTLDNNVKYPKYLSNTWHALFVPTIWWTLVYLLFLPWVQQVNHYHDVGSFLWHFINGNAAPHMWYNTMMLQFIILMPIFWGIGRWVKDNLERGMIVLMSSVVITAIWLGFFDTQIFHGPHATDWYLFDRLFMSFLIYAIGGLLAYQFNDLFKKLLHKWWPILLVLAAGVFYWTNQELFSYSGPLNLANATYYKPSMMIYALLVILLVSALANFQIEHRLPFTGVVHNIANFAYKAYLSNILWSQLIWKTFGQNLTVHNTWLGIIVTYVLTWILSFISAYVVHMIWSRVKTMVLK
jgi:hypothetical protein